MSAGDRAPGARLLVYSQDGLGLGHLRRTSTLVAEVSAARPDVGVLTVSDSPLGRFFPTGGNHDYLKLPSIQKVGPGRWAAVTLPMPFGEVISLRQELLRAAAVRFRPDVVLVDHMPHGAMGELLPTLKALHGTGARLVLGLRDILDAPEVVRRRWSVEGGYEAVDRYYDQVLVYGQRDVFDLPTEYAWPADVASRLRFCGYVGSPAAPTAEARRLRTRLLSALTPGASDGALVVATAGGGADAYPVFSELVAAAPDIVAARACGFVIIAGPFLPAAEFDDLRRRARGLPIRVHRSIPNVPTYLAAADLVVSMAGYNTTVEILGSGRQGLLVPRRGPSAEQRLRATRFAARRWVHQLDPEALDRASVAAAVTDALSGAAELTPREAPDLRGSAVAAEALISLLDEQGAGWQVARAGVPAVAGHAPL